MRRSLQNVTNLKFVNLKTSSPPSGSLRAAFFSLLFIFMIFNFYETSLADHDGLEEIVTINDTESGRLLIETNHAGQYYIAPTVDTDVQMDITGLIARVNITQHFTNPSAEWVNGIYVFPLPENAAVDHMNMIIGERIIAGKIKKRKQAKQIYELAKQQGKKASLIEQQRSNIFTNSVANIGPNEKISISIQYQQTLSYDQGQFSIRFPMVVGIRYIPGTQKVAEFNGLGWAMNTDQVPDASSITPPVIDSDQGHNNPVSININLDAGFPIVNVESRYHPISKQINEANQYRIQLINQATPANRDFELTWRPQTTHEPQAALFTQDKDNDRYGLLMLMPPEVDWSKQQTLAKEMIYVIDTSGSMSGESMQQAKQALLLGLSQLKSEDWFNIIQFNSYTEAFSEHALPARENNIDRAKKYVNSLLANGGTEIAPALKTALSNVKNSERIRQVIFLTDGSVGNEKQLFKIIKRKLNNNRLFTVGIGSAPNSYFMSEAASLGRGTFTYIGKIEEVQEKMTQLFQKLNHPVLSDIEMIWKDDSNIDHWPNPIHDLYIGEPLIVSLRLPKDQKQLIIKGHTNQTDWSTDLPITDGGKETGLNVLWARNKIQSLSQKISHGANAEEIKQAITALGLEHHIVTKHTSLVAVDVTPTKPTDLVSKDKAVPVKKPHGWNMNIPGNIPQGGTPAQMNLMLGILLLITGFMLRRYVIK
ncbi:MAG: marine proteobacterial sortase target protein [Gammaproteobacteria bacterium]|nr:MAG: marine proteobacterial sortase target protein [Gammaproteobacteria bacterium]